MDNSNSGMQNSDSKMQSSDSNMQSSTTGMQNSTTNTTDRRMVTGMFSDRDSAEKAYNTLSSRGYGKDDINVMMSDDTRKKHFKNDERHTELGTKAMEGAGKGSAIGGTLGAIIGAVAAIGTNLLIPGLGLVVAGPLAAGLAGAGAGGLAGGLLGALIGSGIPEEHAKKYEHGIKNGRIVMGVHPRNDDDANYISNDWRVNKGEDIYA
jgi:hypothetical protein